MPVALFATVAARRYSLVHRTTNASDDSERFGRPVQGAPPAATTARLRHSALRLVMTKLHDAAAPGWHTGAMDPSMSSASEGVEAAVEMLEVVADVLDMAMNGKLGLACA